MDTTYNFNDSLKRIDAILQTATDLNISQTIPDRETYGLSGTKVCYGTVASVRLQFNENKIDESLKLNIIESFFSESCQIFRYNSSCRDIIMSGFEMTVIYNTHLKTEIDSVVNDLACIRSLVSVIEKKTNISNGILDLRLSAYYGIINMSVMELSNFSKHILWYGNSIDISRKMLDDSDNNHIQINKSIWNNLNEFNQKLFNLKDGSSEIYEGNISNIIMNNWLIS